MSGAFTFGFDVAYEIGIGTLLRSVLPRLFTDELTRQLAGFPAFLPIQVPLGAPLGLLGERFQTGEVGLDIGPSSTLSFAFAAESTATNRMELRLPITGSLLRLDAVAGLPARTVRVAGIEVELPAVPGVDPLELTPAGTGTVVVPIAIRTSVEDLVATVRFELDGAATIVGPGGSTGLVGLPALPDVPGLTPAERTRDVQAAILAAVERRVRALLPLLPIALGGPNLCGLFPRDLRVDLVRRDATATDGSLMILVKSTAGSSPTPTALASRLPPGVPAELRVANSFLVSLICCIVQRVPSLSFLGTAAALPAPEQGCRWTVATPFTFVGEQFTDGELTLRVDGGGIRIDGRFVRVDRAGDADWSYLTLSFGQTLSFGNDRGVLEIEASDLEIDINFDFSAFAWFIIIFGAGGVGAAIGAFGGWVGTIIGAIIGHIVGAGVLGITEGVLDGIADALLPRMEAALAGLAGGAPLSLLPADVQRHFGGLELVGDPVLDDLLIGGEPRYADPILRRGTLHVPRGSAVDLDAGVIVPASRIPLDGDPDLVWSPSAAGFELRAAGAARMVPVAHSSYETLDLYGVRALPFESLRSLRLPDRALPVGTTRPRSYVLLGVRTSEGRYAKCAVWRAPTGALVVEHTLWRTPAAVDVRRTLTEISRSVARGGGAGIITWNDYRIAWQLTLEAHANTLAAPLRWEWRYEGALLSEGEGSIPGTEATYDARGPVLVVRTPEGLDLRGEVCVTATDAWGRQGTRCLHTGIEGETRIVDEPDPADRDRYERLGPIPRIDRLDLERLPGLSLGDAFGRGLSRGMGIPIEDIERKL